MEAWQCTLGVQLGCPMPVPGGWPRQPLRGTLLDGSAGGQAFVQNGL